jgi:heme oxygenase
MRRPRHAFLRETTRGAHEALEAVLDDAGYFKNLPAYMDYLRRLRLFHAVFERCLVEPGQMWLARWQIGDHRNWLDQDLAALGEGGPGPLSVAPARHPKCVDRASLLGAFYVLLGSTLGAKILVQRFDALGLPSDRGRAYLANLSRSNEVWHDFLSVLEGEPELAESGLRVGAVSTFESITDHMLGAVR